MSARFGRNKRRAAREALAAMAATSNAAIKRKDERIASCVNSINNLDSQVRKHVSFVADLAEFLGEHCALIAAVEKPGTKIDKHAKHFQCSVNRFLPILRYGPSDFPSMDACAQIEQEIMQVLQVEAFSRPLTRNIHFYAAIGSSQAVYAMSESSMRNLSAKDIERAITPALAKALAQEIARNQ